MNVRASLPPLHADASPSGPATPPLDPGCCPDRFPPPDPKRDADVQPNCECCDRDLPPGTKDAKIRTFECTFCRVCVETVLGGVCPNWGGGFVPRPVRPAHVLATYPASSERVLRPEGCARSASAA